MEYTIGEVAKKMNLTISQLRFYDKEGLLSDIKRVNGIRKFTDSDLDIIFLVECLKKTGMQLKEIKEFIKLTKEGDKTIDKRIDFFEKQEKKVIERINELNRSLDLVKYKLWYYKKAKELGSVSKLEKNKDEITPEGIKALLTSAHKGNSR